VPPRFAYWTILIDHKPTAFRARDREELLPTLAQIKRTNQNAELKWFAQGRLWDSPEAQRDSWAKPKQATERRNRDWRPGGEHKDPRARFDKEAQRRRKREERARRNAAPPEPFDSTGANAPPRDHRRPGGSPPRGDRPWTNRPPRPRADNPGERNRDRPWQTKPTGPRAQRKPWQHKPVGRESAGGWRNQPHGQAGRSGWKNRPQSETRERTSADRHAHGSGWKDRPPRGDRPWPDRPPRADRPWPDRPPRRDGQGNERGPGQPSSQQSRSDKRDGGWKSRPRREGGWKDRPPREDRPKREGQPHGGWRPKPRHDEPKPWHGKPAPNQNRKPFRGGPSDGPRKRRDDEPPDHD
jgi:23S rRNA pseudouridine2605 synthase